jgi:hypothetical protein
MRAFPRDARASTEAGPNATSRSRRGLGSSPRVWDCRPLREVLHQLSRGYGLGKESFDEARGLPRCDVERCQCRHQKSPHFWMEALCLPQEPRAIVNRHSKIAQYGVEILSRKNSERLGGRIGKSHAEFGPECDPMKREELGVIVNDEQLPDSARACRRHQLNTTYGWSHPSQETSVHRVPLGAAPRDSSVHPAASPQFSQGSFVLRADSPTSLTSDTSGSILDAFILPPRNRLGRNRPGAYIVGSSGPLSRGSRSRSVYGARCSSQSQSDFRASVPVSGERASGDAQGCRVRHRD